MIKRSGIDSYVKSGGVRCINPDCLSENIEGYSVEIDASVATQEVSCNECDWSWRDEYTLTNVSNIEDTDGKVVTIEKDKE